MGDVAEQIEHPLVDDLLDDPSALQARVLQVIAQVVVLFAVVTALDQVGIGVVDA